MHCTLFIPHLFWPRETAGAVLRGLELPALTKLIARANAERFPPLTPEAWLCQAFEVERQQDWPVAPLTLRLDGGEPGIAYWLRADPVHLRVDRDRLVLVDSTLFEITQAEADALVSRLNAHFAEERLVFQARTPKRWYVKVARAPQLVTRGPGEVAGKDVQRFLPSGNDALAWHRIFNEAQMLLHAHAVNEAREARGEPAVNSVWFWGGGTRAPVRGRHFDAVWSEDALATALATAAESDAQPLPERADSWLERAGEDAEGSHLVVIGALAGAVRYREAEAWRERVRALEARWLAPLAAALRQGRIARLALVAPGSASCWRFEVRRSDLLKFWRGSRPLAAYA